MTNKLIQLFLNQNLITEDEIEIYEYGIFVTWFNALCIFIPICTGAILREFQFTILFFLFFIPVRILLGGFHCKKPQNCICCFELLFIVSLLFYQHNSLSPYKYLIIVLIILACLYRIKTENKESKSPKLVLFICIVFSILALTNAYLLPIICGAFTLNIFFFYLELFLKIV